MSPSTGQASDEDRMRSKGNSASNVALRNSDTGKKIARQASGNGGILVSSGSVLSSGPLMIQTDSFRGASDARPELSATTDRCPEVEAFKSISTCGENRVSVYSGPDSPRTSVACLPAEHPERNGSEPNPTEYEGTRGGENLAKPQENASNARCDVITRPIGVAPNTPLRRPATPVIASPCVICGGAATDLHQGVGMVCGPCRWFFKKMCRLPVWERPVCQDSDACPTTIEYRGKKCRACRLKKCFAAGMIPGERLLFRNSRQLFIRAVLGQKLSQRFCTPR